jgi:hypothetical protein
VPDPLLYKHNGATLPRSPLIPGKAFWITTSRWKAWRPPITKFIRSPPSGLVDGMGPKKASWAACQEEAAN